MNQSDDRQDSLANQIRSGLSYVDIEMTDAEMHAVCQRMKKYTGVTLPSTGKKLVVSRLIKRIQHHKLATVGQYMSLLESGSFPLESSFFVDALTTNETYFFREPAHFEFITKEVLPNAHKHTRHFRVWSAAASEGQEAYSVAMTLDASAGYMPWEVFGSDINRQVIDTASRGIYPVERLELMPADFLRTYCLKGTGPMEGRLSIIPKLKERVSFDVLNLMGNLPAEMGKFDAIFLRNVLIYFDKHKQAIILKNILSKLKPHGTLFVGISEHIDHQQLGLTQIQKSIFVR